jgi:RNA polymerase sigma-70 factor, ECF subfamily
MGTPFSSDRQLVQALLAGDPAAFEAYFHGYYPRLFRFALRRTGRPALAEEFAQDAIAKGLTLLSDYRGEASLLTWLAAICRSEIAMARRRNPHQGTSQPFLEDLPEIRAALELLARPDLEPQAVAQQQELRLLVQAVLDFLPSGYGDVLEWKYVDGLTVVEMAQRLGRSEKATESMLSRARAAFRQAVNETFASRAELLEL